jgi:hypothetical protein
MFNLLPKFAKLKSSDKRMVFEAVFFLFIARMTILFLPYKVLKYFLGKYKNDTENANFDSRTVRRVSNIIRAVSKRLPWKCNCLPQAITAKQMLKLRRINSKLCLGMGKDANKKLIAHAWLITGSQNVTGCAIKEEFTEVAYFG